MCTCTSVPVACSSVRYSNFVMKNGKIDELFINSIFMWVTILYTVTATLNNRKIKQNQTHSFTHVWLLKQKFSPNRQKCCFFSFTRYLYFSTNRLSIEHNQILIMLMRMELSHHELMEQEVFHIQRFIFSHCFIYGILMRHTLTGVAFLRPNLRTTNHRSILF